MAAIPLGATIALECLDPDDRTANMFADKLNLSFTSDPIYINGKVSRARP